MRRIRLRELSSWKVLAQLSLSEWVWIAQHVLSVCFRRIERLKIVAGKNVDVHMRWTKLSNKLKLCMILYIEPRSRWNLLRLPSTLIQWIGSMSTRPKFELCDPADDLDSRGIYRRPGRTQTGTTFCNFCSRLHETGTKCLVDYIKDRYELKTGDSWNYITFTSRLLNILFTNCPNWHTIYASRQLVDNRRVYCSQKIISFI